MKIGMKKSAQAQQPTVQLFTADIADYRLEESLRNLTDREIMEYVFRNSKKIPVKVASALIN